MPIELTHFERGDPFPGDAAATLVALRERIGHAQLADWAMGRRTIILLEGAEGSGKTETVRQLAAALDPRFVTTHVIQPERRRSGEGHWLARFWRDLPAAGRTVLYFHGWYERVLEEKVLGLVDEPAVARAYDEINEFESQQRDHGTTIIKMLFHATNASRDRRIRERAADPHERALLGPEELRSSEARQAYGEATRSMLAQTNTRWSPWTVIDANDDEGTLVAALGAIAAAMEAASTAGERTGKPATAKRRSSARALNA